MKKLLPIILCCVSGLLAAPQVMAQSFNPQNKNNLLPSRDRGSFRNNAAPGNERIRKIEAIKVGYITRDLDLSPQESEQFWPVYNQYQSELRELNQQRRQQLAQNRLTDEQRTDEQFKYEQRVLDLRKRYRNEFRKVLPADKVTKLYQSEKEFKNELIKQLKDRD